MPAKIYAKGETKTPEYIAWVGMKQRCYNPNHHKYYLYGARGIIVCGRWLNDFSAFLADMGRRPSPQHSIDRINGKGNYEPSNCRWATKSEQAENRPDFNHMIEFKGKTQSVSAWAREYGITRELLKDRLRWGWSIEDALFTPLLPTGGCYHGKLLMYQGQLYTRVSLASKLNLNLNVLKERLQKGYSLDEAIYAAQHYQRNEAL